MCSLALFSALWLAVVWYLFRARWAWRWYLVLVVLFVLGGGFGWLEVLLPVAEAESILLLPHYQSEGQGGLVLDPTGGKHYFLFGFPAEGWSVAGTTALAWLGTKRAPATCSVPEARCLQALKEIEWWVVALARSYVKNGNRWQPDAVMPTQADSRWHWLPLEAFPGKPRGPKPAEARPRLVTEAQGFQALEACLARFQKLAYTPTALKAWQDLSADERQRVLGRQALMRAIVRAEKQRLATLHLRGPWHG